MVFRNLLALLFSIVISANVMSLDVGHEAPEIIMKNTEGKEVTLSSLKGKIVLVDFWASWCHPCREANPFLIEAYLKYHHKGFEIVSISLDEDKAHWVKAIEHDKLPWENHLSDLKGWESQVVKDYKVQALPTSYLLDRDGKIVALDPFAEDLELELQEIFMREISFYPKNATNSLYFSLPVKYEIRNEKGKKVLKGEDEIVDISSLEVGVYTIEFADKKEQFLKKQPSFGSVVLKSYNSDEIVLSANTAYELKNEKGDILKEGSGSSINISSLHQGEYYLHFNGRIEKIIKK